MTPKEIAKQTRALAKSWRAAAEDIRAPCDGDYRVAAAMDGCADELEAIAERIEEESLEELIARVPRFEQLISAEQPPMWSESTTPMLRIPDPSPQRIAIAADAPWPAPAPCTPMNIGADLGRGPDLTFGVAGRRDALGNIQIDSVSVIDHCIYCGARDLSVPGTHPITGLECTHPTRVRPLEQVTFPQVTGANADTAQMFNLETGEAGPEIRLDPIPPEKQLELEVLAERLQADPKAYALTPEPIDPRPTLERSTLVIDHGGRGQTVIPLASLLYVNEIECCEDCPMMRYEQSSGSMDFEARCSHPKAPDADRIDVGAPAPAWCPIRSQSMMVCMSASARAPEES